MKKVSTAATKQSRNFSQQKLTIGLDLGDRSSCYCVLDEAGNVRLEQRLSTTAKALRDRKLKNSFVNFWVRCDSVDPNRQPCRGSLLAILVECKLGAIDGSNDRIGGWLLMYQMLAQGQWLIADTCPKLIAAIPSRVHDPRRPGDLLKVGGDPLDDAMDAARYGLYSWVTASEKPREMRMREAVRELDLTSASIRWQQMLAEERFKNSPRRVSWRELWLRRGMWR